MNVARGSIVHIRKDLEIYHEYGHITWYKAMKEDFEKEGNVGIVESVNYKEDGTIWSLTVVPGTVLKECGNNSWYLTESIIEEDLQSYDTESN